ncbi:MAG TPA: hypothetical protein VMU34_20505, partial [Mycobacterium sp.]|nr:hypothetical protein [Mycobacterium sp.]
MWCPSVSLSVWANAWLAGTAAPDDVLDALAAWAPKHSVAGPGDLDGVGAVSLLQTVRSAAGPRGMGCIGIVLPVAGDVRGLAAGTAFERDALGAGEAVVVSGGPGAVIGLVPEFGSS